MPVRRPALVHDLARENGMEIERLLAHGAKDVPLPCLELRRVLGDEPQQVALGFRRERGAGALERRLGHRSAARQVVEALLETALLHGARGVDVARIAVAPQELNGIDMRLERERRVEHLLDASLAVLLDGRADLPRMRGRLLDDAVADLLLAALE